jgi:hypothetical protein
MSFICNFCKQSVKSKYNLKSHIEKNKKCLKSRGIAFTSKFVCEGCNLTFTNNSNLITHKDICKFYIILKIKEETTVEITSIKNKYENTIKNLKDDYENNIKKLKDEYETKHSLETIELKNIIKIHQLKIIDNEKIIKDIQSQNDKLLENLQKLASQAIDRPTLTTTNVTNNIKNNFSDKYFLETIKAEDVKMKCQNYLTEQVFLEGQRGIAQLCTEHVIKTKDKKSLMLCTDVSRKKFKYIDEQGNLKEDYEARIFVQKVSKPIKDASRIVYDSILFDVKSEKETLEEDDYSRKAYLNSKELKTIDCYVQITHFDDPDNNQEFKNELAILNK